MERQNLCVSSSWPEGLPRAVCQCWLEEWTGRETARLWQQPNVCVCCVCVVFKPAKQPKAQEHDTTIKECECLHGRCLNGVHTHACITNSDMSISPRSRERDARQLFCNLAAQYLNIGQHVIFTLCCKPRITTRRVLLCCGQSRSSSSL